MRILVVRVKAGVSARFGVVDRGIRPHLRCRETWGFFPNDSSIWRVLMPCWRAIPERMRGAAIATRSLDSCHARPVNDDGGGNRAGEVEERSETRRTDRRI